MTCAAWVEVMTGCVWLNRICVLAALGSGTRQTIDVSDVSRNRFRPHGETESIECFASKASCESSHPLECTLPLATQLPILHTFSLARGY